MEDIPKDKPNSGALGKFTRNQWAVVCVILAMVIAPITVVGADMSASRASIGNVSSSPSQPTDTDKIDVTVNLNGGAYFILKPSLTINYASQSTGMGGGCGGSSFTNNGNQYKAKIGPFPDGSFVWYVVGMNDRGKRSFSEPQQFTIGQIQSLSSFNTSSTSILWSVDQNSGQITAVCLFTLNTTIPERNLTLSILGFSPDGEFTLSTSVIANLNNSIICQFNPDKQFWTKGTTIFYRLTAGDIQGDIKKSNVERFTIS